MQQMSSSMILTKSKPEESRFSAAVLKCLTMNLALVEDYYQRARIVVFRAYSCAITV